MGLNLVSVCIIQGPGVNTVNKGWVASVGFAIVVLATVVFDFAIGV
jgi:hypothetical protein